MSSHGPAVDIAGRLRLVVARLSRLVRTSVQDGSGTTASQWSALASIEASGPTRLTDLAGLEGIAVSTLSRVVDGLIEAGWVSRRADASDRRTGRLTCTTAGLAHLDKLRTEAAGRLADRIGALRPAEVRLLVAALPVLERLAELPARGAGLHRRPATSRTSPATSGTPNPEV